jgi:hypothetical protein
MKSINFKALLPHLIAIGIFLLVSVIFCRPALESGVILQQSDVTAVESMKRQSEEYKEKTGTYPLWITSMFSGMPAYNIIFDGPHTPIVYINKLFQLWLPKPLNFFFLSCVCFYIFCLCLRIRPWIAILGSIAFAYSTYNPILVVAGHDTKLLALAYAPALLGSIILLFNRQYWTGFVLTTLFANLHLLQNHQQISYYLLIVIALLSISYLIYWIINKELFAGLKGLGLALVAGLLGLMMNAIIIFPVYDYANDSKRGGQLVMDKKDVASDAKITNNKTSGLSRDYAFQWSNGRAEAFSFLLPGIAGYGTYYSQRDGEYSIFPKLGESSNVAAYLTEKLNVPESQLADNTAQLSDKLYWGGKPFTTGPAYMGSVVVILFIISLFLIDAKYKWWLLATSITGILMSMGKYLPGFNNLLFDSLPLYNKFRTPEMSLVIPQLLFPIGAVLGVSAIADANKENIKKQLKWAGIAVAATVVVCWGLYFSSNYGSENKQRTSAVNAAFAKQDNNVNQQLQEISQKYEAERDNRTYEELLYMTKGNTEVARGLVNAIKKDREALLRSDVVKMTIYTLLTIGIIALFVFGKINLTILLVALPVLVAADLLPFGLNYLNKNSFDAAEKYQSNQFSPSNADKQILADKDPNYRVFNLSGGDPFQDAKPSYFHKSVGGYHPAKIGIYDDLATYQLSGQPNPNVLNMLNAKYIIQKSADGKDETAVQNPGALGNCWFVKGAIFVNGQLEEMKTLTTLNTRDSAVLDNLYKPIIGTFVPADSSATIKQTAFDNMAITYQSSSKAAHLAVFSEIFYKDWFAYIDGNKVPVAKANYVLRALVIPAGEHKIEFKFEPAIMKSSYNISMITNWLLFAMLIGFGIYWFKKSR